MKEKTEYGGICPIEKFSIDSHFGGGYNKDPVEECMGCNLSDRTQEIFANVCQAPEGITRDLYFKFNNEYAELKGELTREGFQEYVIKQMKTKTL